MLLKTASILSVFAGGLLFGCSTPTGVTGLPTQSAGISDVPVRNVNATEPQTTHLDQEPQPQRAKK